MPRKLDPIIAETLKKYGLGTEALWDCHGTWVVYHRYLEQIAVKASIKFDPPMVLEANGAGKCVALCVRGYMGEVSDWSIGEAAPGNNKNGYPYAMAEKRARDRVILKLIGLHGLAYSEEEADEFKAPVAEANGHTPPSNTDLDGPAVADELVRQIKATKNPSEYQALIKSGEFSSQYQALPESLFGKVTEAGRAHYTHLRNPVMAG